MTFQVTVQPAQLVFQTQADDTLLQAALQAKVALPYGCQDGACGSCKCKVLSGDVQQGPHQSKALSEQEQQEGWVLACCARAQSDVVIEARTVAGALDFPAQKMPVRVSELQPLAPDVMRVRLQLPATTSFKYRAGQFVDVLLRDGARRSYSMANAPHALGEPQGIELHIRHMAGGKFTDHVFSAMKEKEILRVEGPLGTFFLREDTEKPLIFLASGTGFAPIKALIEHWLHTGSQRPITLFWGGRGLSDLYMHDWCINMAQQHAALTYVPVLSDEIPSDWAGRTGFVHRAVMADFPDLSGHEVYACGAPVMVHAAHAEFVSDCSLPEASFIADIFTSAKDQIPA